MPFRCEEADEFQPSPLSNLPNYLALAHILPLTPQEKDPIGQAIADVYVNLRTALRLTQTGNAGRF